MSMKQLLLSLGFVVMFFECQAFIATEKTDTSGRRILIINDFDPSNMKARDNKKELFAELADSLKQYLAKEINGYSGFEAVVSEQLFPNIEGISLDSLLQKYDCTSAIKINNLNVYFEQTDVEVTKISKGSKSRNASYDLCAVVQCHYYTIQKPIVPLEKRNCSFFTNRNVASGLLAAGPDVVGKRKYTYNAIKENAVLLVSQLIYR